MFNKKSFLIFLSFLFLVSVFNLFSDVTLEYVGISLDLYKEFEISCGTVVEIVSNIGNQEFMDSLGVNRRSCIGSAFVKIINFITRVVKYNLKNCFLITVNRTKIIFSTIMTKSSLIFIF